MGNSTGWRLQLYIVSQSIANYKELELARTRTNRSATPRSGAPVPDRAPSDFSRRQALVTRWAGGLAPRLLRRCPRIRECRERSCLRGHKRNGLRARKRTQSAHPERRCAYLIFVEVREHCQQPPRGSACCSIWGPICQLGASSNSMCIGLACAGESPHTAIRFASRSGRLSIHAEYSHVLQFILRPRPVMAVDDDDPRHGTRTCRGYIQICGNPHNPRGSGMPGPAFDTPLRLVL